MSRNRRNRLRGYAEPVLRGRPLFIRLCEAFVDNLSLILRIALIMGAISFVDTYLDQKAKLAPTDESQPEQIAVEEEPPAPDSIPDSEEWKTPGVVHALNCTFAEYRDKHYDECVDDSSEVYKRPGADPDDTSFVPDDELVLYASLIPDS